MEPSEHTYDQSWAGAFDLVPRAGCDATDSGTLKRPHFGPIGAPSGGDAAGRALEQPALFVNDAFQVFRIAVAGSDEEAITAFSEDVKLCMSAMDIGTQDLSASQPDVDGLSDGVMLASDHRSLELSADPTSEMISLAFLGTLPEQEDIDGTIEQVVSEQSADDWEHALAELGLEPPPDPEESRLLIDFAVDPRINYGRSHCYYVGYCRAVHVKLTVVAGYVSYCPVSHVDPTPQHHWVCVTGWQNGSWYGIAGSVSVPTY